MSYNEGRERYEARDDYDNDSDGWDIQDELAADPEDQTSTPSKYRCLDAMCGALDCSRCHPGHENSREDTEC